ncbi:hypothetical protein [Clostridium perfringens]|uniref:hypothetical protein n=1 Tax=Clostridium perfringens TaxID=1502 RepID=UPI001E60220C|nr:hypothetical protein [Clostridium perfringens]WVL78312.1 hypothetical protein LMS42_015220 [Clostridium perfringens]
MKKRTEIVLKDGKSILVEEDKKMVDEILKKVNTYNRDFLFIILSDYTIRVSEIALYRSLGGSK